MQTALRANVTLSAGTHALRVRSAYGGTARVSPLVVAGGVALAAVSPATASASAGLISGSVGVSLSAASAATASTVADLRVPAPLAAVASATASQAAAVTVRVPLAAAAPAVASSLATVEIPGDIFIEAASPAVASSPAVPLIVAVPLVASSPSVASGTGPLLLGELITMSAAAPARASGTGGILTLSALSAVAPASFGGSGTLLVALNAPTASVTAQRRATARRNIYEPVSMTMTQAYKSTSVIEENFRRIADLIGGEAFIGGAPYRVSHGRITEANFSSGQKFTNDQKLEPYSYFVQQVCRPKFDGEVFEFHGVASSIPVGQTYAVVDARFSFAYGASRTFSLIEATVPEEFETVSVAGLPWQSATTAVGASRQITPLVGLIVPRVDDAKNDVIRLKFSDNLYEYQRDFTTQTPEKALGPVVTLTFKAKHVA